MIGQSRRSTVLFAMLVVAFAGMHPVTGCATDVTWLDVDGDPLPFATLDEIERFLESADIVSNEAIPTGRSGPRKLLLEQNGVRANAAFNAVDELVRGITRHHGLILADFHDFHLYGCAAYRLDRLLDLHRVPPTVPREVEGTSGSVSLWIEDTIMESDRAARDLQPPDPFRWNQQKKIMVVFDNLIGNIDRNQGNVLIDRTWRLWFIDHTRAFLPSPELTNPTAVSRCERGLYGALQELDPQSVRRELSPFLEGPQIDAVLARRDRILERLRQEIDRFGESVVLFELRPPGTDVGDW